MAEIPAEVPLTLDGIGEQYPQPDPRGWLVFTYLPTGLQNAEDSTALDDREQRHWLYRVRKRPATTAERTLLIHLGFSLPPELETRVEFLTNSVRRRTWPQLDGTDPETDKPGSPFAVFFGGQQ